MVLRIPARDVSLALTGCSLALGLVNIGLGRRVNYLDHLLLFNLLAASMLALAAVALLVAVVPLARARGKSGSLWLASALATALIARFLLDG